VRVHQHASGVEKSGDRCVRRSRGGLTAKIHARVDAKGRPVHLRSRRATSTTSHMASRCSQASSRVPS
jgi:hypothetical protein